MPNTKFDAKSFNPEAFKYKADRIPRTRLNEIRKCWWATRTSVRCSQTRTAPAMQGLPCVACLTGMP